MILDSLVNHIPRALAEYSLLLGGWPAYEHKHSLSSRFLDSRQNALKIILALKSKTSEEISASGYNLYFYQLNC